MSCVLQFIIKNNDKLDWDSVSILLPTNIIIDNCKQNHTFPSSDPNINFTCKHIMKMSMHMINMRMMMTTIAKRTTIEEEKNMFNIG